MNFEVLTTGGEPDKVGASAWQSSAIAFVSARVPCSPTLRRRTARAGAGPNSLR